MEPMRAFLFAASATAFFTLTATAQTAPRPAAPHVTVGANLKQLAFDWDAVPNVTHYQLFQNPNGNTGYTPLGDPIPPSRTDARVNIAVHLQNWASARYIVAACNAVGCTDSAEIFPKDLMLDTIGYFKASNADADDLFGRDVALSNDGRTLAVSAEQESSAAVGVNGNQADNSSPASGAVYVFRRTSAGWKQEAYLKPPVNRPGIRFGTGDPELTQRALALSADGSIVVVGAPSQDLQAFAFSGEVYVFRRASDGSWSLSATLRSPEPGGFDFFGVSVDLSLDGRTLKVSSLNPRDDDGNPVGSTHIFDASGTSWQHQATLGPVHASNLCARVRMSGDGLTLVAKCTSPAGNLVVTLQRVGEAWFQKGELTGLPDFTHEQPLALNFDATRMALTLGGTTSTVAIYRRDGLTWVREATLTAPGDHDPYNAFGQSLAFTRDGRRLAIGDYLSWTAGSGVSRTAPNGTVQQGAVFVYQRSGALPSPWRLRSVVKAPNPGPGEDLFGHSVSFCGTGHALAVGAFLEDSNARGIDGNQLNERRTNSGAVYLY
jgi:trimeric autotransporter adhesin